MSGGAPGTDDALPNLVVIGAMKAGTTALWSALRQHPDVFMCEPKEPEYFVAEKSWDRGLDWYRSLFAPGAGRAVRGEASADYTKADIYPGVPARMAAVVPGARLLYLVRHPIDRMRSMYRHQVVDGREDRPIERALREGAHYLATSRYAWQLEQYEPWFPRQQILVLASEALRDAPEPALRRVFAFLGVDPGRAASIAAEANLTTGKRAPRAAWRRWRQVPPVRWARRVAPGPVREAAWRLASRPVGAAPVPGDLRAELEEALRPDVARLRGWLAPDFDGWGIA